MNKKRAAVLIGTLMMILLLGGCAGGDRRTGRFLLYEQYRTDLSRLGSGLKDAFVFSVITDKKVVTITFDDGPSKSSDKILSTLKRLDTPATYFLVAANVTLENFSPYRDALFGTELHGYLHSNFLSLDRESSFAQVSRARTAFATLGIKPEYFRPPYGNITVDLKDALRANNLTGILWSLDSLDWNHLAGDKLVQRVVSNVTNGDIILFHETPWTAKR